MRNDFITKSEKLFIIMQFYHFKDTDSRILLYWVMFNYDRVL